MRKLGIIGMGDMGSKYAYKLFTNKDIGYEIVATTRIKGAALERVKDYIKDVKTYYSDEDFFKAYDNGEFMIDTVLIVTPHMAHKYAVIEAFKRGLDVICDKPAGAFLKDGREMLEAKKDNKYGFIFHQRTYPIYEALYDIIKNNKYGTVKRINYIVTDWFRTESYYNSSAWRATYKTDGGGTILNQCPHSIDLLCHIFGLPDEIMAFASEGKYHSIEVEDEVTAFFRYDNGITGVFIASTGEIPGINRMEITTTKALITVLKNEIIIKYLENDDKYYLGLEHKNFSMPSPNEIKLKYTDNDAYRAVFERFDKDMVCDGKEALMSLYFGNAVYLSSWKKEIVRLYPIGSKEELAFEEEFSKYMNERM